jgi:hypothetical protein
MTTSFLPSGFACGSGSLAGFSAAAIGGAGGGGEEGRHLNRRRDRCGGESVSAHEFDEQDRMQRQSENQRHAKDISVRRSATSEWRARIVGEDLAPARR